MSIKKIFYSMFFVAVALSLIALISYYTLGYNVLEHLPPFWDWIISWGFGLAITALCLFITVASIIAIIKHKNKK